MTETEILKFFDRLGLQPGQDDVELIRDALASRRELVLAVWVDAYDLRAPGMKKAHFLMCCAGGDDPAFLQAVADRQEIWNEGWYFLRSEPPPPVDVYHLTAVGGVVSSQILKRSSPASETKAASDARVPHTFIRLHGLGQAILRRSLRTRSAVNVRRGRI